MDNQHSEVRRLIRAVSKPKQKSEAMARRNTWKQALAREVTGIGFLLPALLPMVLFVFYPIVRSFVLSFYSYNMVKDAKYIGLRNFTKLFSSREIVDTMMRTLSYTAIVVPVVLAGGFLIGVMLSKPRKANVVLRTVFFAPYVTSMVAISTVWLYIFHPQYGILNQALGLIGIMPVRWLNDTATAFWSVAFVTVWRTIGYNVIVFIGGIQNISQDVLEASMIDGASRWETIRSIIFPLCTPTMFMLTILNTIDIMKMYTTINVLTEGGPARSTQNMVVMLQDYGFNRFQIGYASAISTVLFLMILLIHILQRIMERKVQYDQ